MPESNISVMGKAGGPSALILCDHEPDGVASPTEPVTLEVAAGRSEDDPDKKR